MTTTDLVSRLEDVDAAQRAGTAVEPGQKTLKDVLREMEPQLRGVLPGHLDLSRFLLLAVNEVSTVPRLAECTAASVVSGVIRAAKLGLEFSNDRGQAYLIPRWNGRAKQMEATFQVGYKGLIDLAGRGGITVRARDVRAADRFEVEDGLNPVLRHVPELKKPRGEAWAYFGVATMPDGAKEFLVMSRSEIEEHRDRFASARNKKNEVFGPWVEHFDAMARKTIVIRLLGNLPLPVEVAAAIAADDVPIDLTPDERQLPPGPPDSDASPKTAEQGPPPPAQSEGDHDERSPDVPPAGAKTTSPPQDPVADDPDRRELAAYLLDEARKADHASTKAWQDANGISSNFREWSAEQISQIIDWVHEEPEPS